MCCCGKGTRKERREIGIRNALGAPLAGLIFILSKRFLLILLIASVSGLAGGYFVSEMLMDSIWDYFTPITAGMLLFSALTMIAITAITISGKTYKAATQNPVKAIQTE